MPHHKGGRREVRAQPAPSAPALPPATANPAPAAARAVLRLLLPPLRAAGQPWPADRRKLQLGSRVVGAGPLVGHEPLVAVGWGVGVVQG